MALEQKDFELIENYLRDNLPRILAQQSLAKPPVVYEIELRERMVRVEEELNHQRELMQKGFELMEKRFEMVDKRFELLEKRMELLKNRFDLLSKRLFQFMIWSFGLIVSETSVIIAFIKL
ncbi:MAG: hypothetical protein N3F66_13480 [Spirochaetes bacterium]|nr:hypothetical protein [Spirochaetota bacterium]